LFRVRFASVADVRATHGSRGPDSILQGKRWQANRDRPKKEVKSAHKSLALLEKSGEFFLLVSDAIGDALLICRARQSSSLLL
jgi:hypothetical protein